MPGDVGEVHTFPLKVPTDALHVSPFVKPPLAVAENVIWPGAVVWFAGTIGVIVTGVGVTTHVVVTTVP